ncbi:MAG: nuclear transport factor 2 family protein [Caulobacteraceae bacterium]
MDEGWNDAYARCDRALLADILAEDSIGFTAGEVFGVSKQAAQKRFRSEFEEGEGVEPGQIEGRLGATAFNEARILDQGGRKGNELVRVGALALVFEKTGRVWEHRRAVAVTAELAMAKLAKDGWVYVASWFPFHYFKRQAGE